MAGEKGGQLLLCSLGPVQDFIAAARRCQDLWFGSWMLSDLARATATALSGVAGTDALVFPGALGNDKSSVANKILVILSPDKPAGSTAEAGKRGLDQRLATFQSRFARLPSTYLRREVANSQLRDLMDYQWAAVPLAAGYAAARDRAEGLLAARKNARDWHSVPWTDLAGAGVPKCAVCGQRESVIEESLFDGDMEGVRQRASQFRLRSMERLCGVCLLKRLGQELTFNDADHVDELGRPPFHSTSHVAAAPLLARIARQGAAGEQLIAAYVADLKTTGVDLARYRIRSGYLGQGLAEFSDPTQARGAAPPLHVPRVFAQQGANGLDGCLLFETRMEEILDECGVTPSREVLDRLRNKTRQVLHKLGVAQAHPYYGLLLADGDRMGVAIAELAKRPEAAELHRRLSCDLERFAGEALEIVERHGGSGIYAGGDDVLALLPMHGALACADELRRKFADLVQPICVEANIDARPTLSVGIAVCHHLDDLADAREAAHRAERLAKVTRNALGIVVCKRSGGELACAGQWDEEPNLAVRIDEACRLFSSQQIPEGVAYDLEESMRVFDRRLGSDLPHNASDLARSLARRVLQKKRAAGGARPVDSRLFDAMRGRLDRSTDVVVEVRKLAEELQVARAFLEAYQAAWGPMANLEEGR